MKIKVHILMLIAFLCHLSTSLFALDMFDSINKAKIYKYPDKSEINNILSEFNKKFSIEFVYSSQCGFCHKLSYILKNLQENNRVKIESITADGGFIHGFENALYSEEYLKLNNIKAYPTLVAKDINSNQRYLIAEGYLSEIELRGNIGALLNYVQGVRYE